MFIILFEVSAVKEKATVLMTNIGAGVAGVAGVT